MIYCDILYGEAKEAVLVSWLIWLVVCYMNGQQFRAPRLPKSLIYKVTMVLLFGLPHSS